mgnify:CR=1 FL=1|jgi:mannosyltransferase OCH1-like enzyme
MSTNKVIQSLWIGNSLSTMEKLCISSYIQNGHEFHLYKYNDIDGIPNGTIIKDANKIISSKDIFLDSRGGVASFSDWFRYKLLYDRGGWWVDMDTVCLKYFDINEEYAFSREGFNMEKGSVNNGFIKSPSKAEFLKDLLLIIEQKKNQKIIWGEFGPTLLRNVLQNYDSNMYIHPPEVFCPIYWTENYKLISQQNFKFSDKTYAIHLWNEIWRLGCLNKDAIYHPDSIYEKLKFKYINL